MIFHLKFKNCVYQQKLKSSLIQLMMNFMVVAIANGKIMKCFLFVSDDYWNNSSLQCRCCIDFTMIS